LICALLPLLAGCANQDAPAPAYPDIRFIQSPALAIDAASVEIVDQFVPGGLPPEVETKFPVSPQRAMHNWATDQLAAANPGAPYRLVVTILDASVKEVDLDPTGQGLKAAFTREASERYDAHESMRIALLDGSGLPVRSVTADASMSRSLMEASSPDDRQALWYGIARDLTANLGQTLVAQIANSFPPYLR
jgi:hypothetical protein